MRRRVGRRASQRLVVAAAFAVVPTVFVLLPGAIPIQPGAQLTGLLNLVARPALVAAAAHSLIASLMCAAGICSGALVLALFARRAHYLAVVLLAFASIPALLGDSGVAVLIRPFVGRFYSLNPAPMVDYGLLFLANAWQYGPLVTLILLLRLSSLSTDQIDLLQSVRATAQERVELSEWPHLRPVFFLLFAFTFTAVFRDADKPSVAFYFGRGSGFELWPQWLARISSEVLVSQPFLALGGTVRVASATAILAVLCALVGAWVTMRVVDGAVRVFGRASPSRHSVTNVSRRVVLFGFASAGVLSVGIVFVVALAAAGRVEMSSAVLGIREVALGAVAAILIGSSAVVLASGTRIALFMGRVLYRKDVYVWIALFAARCMLPVGIALSLLAWEVRTGLHGALGNISGWLVGETILHMPIVTAFLVVSFLPVSASETDLFDYYRASTGEAMELLFVRRASRDIAFVVLFAFAAALSEPALSNLFSPDAPSLALALHLAVGSRVASMASAASAALVLVTPVVVATGLWCVGSVYVDIRQHGGAELGAD